MNCTGAVLRTAGSALTLESLAIGNLAASDVVVRIGATSLCHTDLEAVEGHLGTPLPMLPGHEAAGIVDWIGPAVTTVAVGDHVIISWNPHCGTCFYCARQQPILCQDYRANAAKHALAQQFGATHTLVADDGLVAAHADITDGRGADYVFEAAGNAASFRSSMEMVRPGGQVVWLGKVPVNDDVAIP